jgi:DNA polymerase elongation subunit (family B)
MKKKYVANKLMNFEEILIGKANQPKFHLECKGIETVRRDGCQLARDTLEKVINILIETGDSELDARYQKIIDLFTKLNTSITEVPLDHLLFSRQLTKKPKDYANAESLPHVKVANDRIKAGEKDDALVNHAIFYLICKPINEETSLAKNAYDLRTFQRSQRTPSHM